MKFLAHSFPNILWLRIYANKLSCIQLTLELLPAAGLEFSIQRQKGIVGM